MQNDFEKQVQQKMEELKLVPSRPVWEKVEMQIRKEKDRRRVLFWIPLLALIGAGLWIGIDKYAQTSAFKSPAPVKEKSVGAPATGNNAPVESFKTVPATTSGHQVLRQSQIESKHFNPNDVRRTSANVTESDRAIAKEAISKEEKISVPVHNETVKTESTEHIEKTRPLKDEAAPNTQANELKSIDTIGVTKPVVNTTTQAGTQDSVSVKAAPIKKYAISRKWKYGLLVASGWSGLGRVEFYNGQKSMNAFSSPVTNGGTGQFVSYGPSTIEKGLAFTVGGTAKKQLTRRTAFATGLRYDYYSNTIQVGSQVNQNRTIQNYPVSTFYYSATQYYSGQTTVLQPYKNQYHFVSMPADMEWQMLKKHPLNLSFGLSFQYLVASNALRYDYTTQSYFHNMSAFNRAQLMSGISMTYSVPLKQKPLRFGPQIQYGLTRLEKGNADNHLFSYGLKAEWQFKN